jgi:hypothetical protein
VEFGVYLQSLGDEETMIICPYVDDLLIIGSKTLEIEKVNDKLKSMK